jgi:hypothetical protein
LNHIPKNTTDHKMLEIIMTMFIATVGTAYCSDNLEFYVKTRLELFRAQAISSVQDYMMKSYDVYESAVSYHDVDRRQYREIKFTTVEYQVSIRVGTLWLMNEHKFASSFHVPSVIPGCLAFSHPPTQNVRLLRTQYHSHVPRLEHQNSELLNENKKLQSQVDSLNDQKRKWEIQQQQMQSEINHLQQYVEPMVASKPSPSIVNLPKWKKPGTTPPVKNKPSNDDISVPAQDYIDPAFYGKSSNDQDNNIWIGDSGASCHMIRDDSYMFDCRPIKSYIKVGDGKTITCNKIGKVRMMVIQNDGTSTIVVLHDCKYVPALFVNLFSITRALHNNWQLSNRGMSMILRKESQTIIFDKIMRTESGCVTGVEMVPLVEKSYTILDREMSTDINDFHRLMGHVNKNSLYLTARHYGVKLKGQLNPCFDCAVSKIRQKNVPKVTTQKSIIPDERLFLDISSTQVRSFGGSNVWILLVDDCTDMCWSLFVSQKSDMPQKVLNLLIQLQNIPTSQP